MLIGEFCQRLHPKCLVITPNQRMAKTLNQTINEFDVNLPKLVLAFDQWFESLWLLLSQYHQQAELLSPHALNIVWERIIQSNEQEFVLKPGPTAKLAIKAWQYACQYQLWPTLKALESDTLSRDPKTFLLWAARFKQICAENNWLDQHTAFELVIQQFFLHAGLELSEVIYLGFGELTPQQLAWNQALQSQGIKVSQSHLIQATCQSRKLACANYLEELHMAAIWAAKKLSLRPDLKIAIVVPDLSLIRNEVKRVFTQYFPQGGLNISAPGPLSHFLMIKTALNLLRLAKNQNLDLMVISSIILSSFVGNAESEQFSRADMDWYLRDQGHAELTLAELNRILANRFNTSKLLSNLQNLEGFAHMLQAKQTLSHWVSAFQQILSIMAWPGARTLDSEEYQLQAQWQILLNKFASLAQVLGKISFARALLEITRLANSTPFSIQSVDVKLEVLGVFEASGLCYDALWISGLNDTHWPDSPNANPFLSHAMQRQFNLPRSNAQREWQVAKRTFQAFNKSATELIVSYAKSFKDDMLRPSFLIDNIEALDPSVVTAWSESRTERQDQKQLRPNGLETYLDEMGPLVNLEEASVGGSRLIQLQALCPFKSFAEIRLNVKPLAKKHLGMRPSDKGQLIHQVLAQLGVILKDQTALQKHQEQQTLADLILNTINQCMQKFYLNDIGFTHSIYFDLEKSRIHALLLNWYAKELLREHFEIRAIEERQVIDLAGLKLKVCLDRIDETSEGLVIIDYKTGLCSINDWSGDRPSDPQLPLYALGQSQVINGLWFAELRVDSVGLKGLHDAPSKGQIKSITAALYFAPTWQEQLKSWQVVIERLAKEFIQGLAKVDPKHASLCNTCHLELLCRVKK